MKVLHVIDTLTIGGAEQSLLAILARFQVYQPMMCHIYPDDTLRSAYESVGIPVTSLNINGRYAFQHAITALSKVVKRENPDLIHSTLFRADVVSRIVGRLSHKPVLSSFVNESYHPMRKQTLSSGGRAKLRAVQELDRLTAYWTQHFVAVSESTKLANCQALTIPESKVSVIYRGRDPKPFLSVMDEEISAARTRLGLPSDAPILLNVARILHRKGQEELVQAMGTVLQHFPNAKLLIAGEGHDRPQLETVIKQSGLENAVYLLGIRHDIPVLLHLADLFVFPSHYEGHPGALVEAMLAARPIVASDIPVHRETITNGKTGCLAAIKNADALAKQIISTLQQPAVATQMGQEARQVALQKFDITQVALQHELLYEKLLSR